MKALLLLMVLLFFGCNPEYRLEINSNTSWSGFFNNASVEGSGSRVYRFEIKEQVWCGTFQKQTENGYLEVKLISEELLGDYVIASGFTDARYGIVSICK